MKSHRNMSVFRCTLNQTYTGTLFKRCIEDNLHLGVSVIKERRDCLEVNAPSTTSAFSIGFLLGEINAKTTLF